MPTQRLTIVNTKRGTEARVHVPMSGILTREQVKSCRARLGAVPGSGDGFLGEFPLDQEPPEAPGYTVRTVAAESADGEEVRIIATMRPATQAAAKRRAAR